jgi:hypothetical protein
VPLPPAALPAVSYLDVLLGNTTLKESSAAATSSSVAISSPILVRKPDDWYFTFYIRKDLGGSFHTYPDLSGPFKSLQEADNAINRHLHDLEDPKMYAFGSNIILCMSSQNIQSTNDIQCFDPY